jgi:hypothetical protein
MRDGNRRWAKAVGRDTSHGHRAGAANIEPLLGWCDEVGIEVVTLWLLSTDNMNRSAAELEPLLGIIAVAWIARRTRLPEDAAIATILSTFFALGVVLLTVVQAMPAGDSEKDVTGRRWEQRVELMRDAIIYNRNNPSVIFYEAGNAGISEEHMRETEAKYRALVEHIPAPSHEPITSDPDRLTRTVEREMRAERIFIGELKIELR